MSIAGRRLHLAHPARVGVGRVRAGHTNGSHLGIRPQPAPAPTGGLCNHRCPSASGWSTEEGMRRVLYEFEQSGAYRAHWSWLLSETHAVAAIAAARLPTGCS